MKKVIVSLALIGLVGCGISKKQSSTVHQELWVQDSINLIPVNVVERNDTTTYTFAPIVMMSSPDSIDTSRASLDIVSVELLDQHYYTDNFDEIRLRITDSKKNIVYEKASPAWKPASYWYPHLDDIYLRAEKYEVSISLVYDRGKDNETVIQSSTVVDLALADISSNDQFIHITDKLKIYFSLTWGGL